MYEISGWIKPKPSNPAEKFMSLSGKPKQARQQAPAPRQAPPAAKQAPKGFDDMDDDIPF
jgi:single-stranded DNA-binding protein